MQGFKRFVFGQQGFWARPIPRSKVPVAPAKLENNMSSGIALPSLVPKKSIKKQWEQFQNQGYFEKMLQMAPCLVSASKNKTEPKFQNDVKTQIA